MCRELIPALSKQRNNTDRAAGPRDRCHLHLTLSKPKSAGWCAMKIHGAPVPKTNSDDLVSGSPRVVIQQALNICTGTQQLPHL